MNSRRRRQRNRRKFRSQSWLKFLSYAYVGKSGDERARLQELYQEEARKHGIFYSPGY